MEQNEQPQQGMAETCDGPQAGQGGEGPANAAPQAEMGGTPAGHQPMGQDPGMQQTGYRDMNPGQTGYVGMPAGQAAPVGQSGPIGANPGQMDRFPGQDPGMGQTGAPGMNPGPSGSPGMNPGQMGPQSGYYQGPGAQGSGYNGSGTNPHMSSGMEGPGCGHMGADANHIHHDENRFGQVADMMGRFLNGEATMGDMVNGFFNLNFRDDQFWKGAAVGAVAAILLNSDTVKGSLAGIFGAAKSEAKTESETSEGKKASSDTKKSAK